MLSNKKSIIILTVLIILFSFLNSTSILANNWPTIENNNINNNQMKKNNGDVNFYDDEVVNLDDLDSKYTKDQKIPMNKNENTNYAHIYQEELPEVKIDDVLAWIYRKGYDIIRGLQVLAQPITILFFIFSSIQMLFGIFGRGDKMSQGIIGMLISSGVYVAILYAPTILKAIASFFTS